MLAHKVPSRLTNNPCGSQTIESNGCVGDTRDWSHMSLELLCELHAYLLLLPELDVSILTRCNDETALRNLEAVLDPPGL